MINRCNVVQEVKKNLVLARSFSLEIDAQIIVAALNLLALRSLDSIPDKCILPTALKEASLHFVDRFVLCKDEMDKLKSKLEKEKECYQMVTSLANILVAKNHLLLIERLERSRKRHMGSKEIMGNAMETTQRDDLCFNYQYALL